MIKLNKEMEAKAKTEPVAAKNEEVLFGFDPSEGAGDRDLSGTMSHEEYVKYLYSLLYK